MNSILSDDSVRGAAERLWPEAGRAELGDLIARAAWTSIVEPSDGVAGAVTQMLGARAALEEAEHAVATARPSPPAGIDAPAWHQALARWRPRFGPDRVTDALRAAHRKSLILLTPDDQRWPEQLNDLGPHAPIALWVHGDPGTLSQRRSFLSIVGARAASPYGEQVAGELADDLSRSGVVVVSGGAYGIDGAAHRAAIRADGATIAVMAGGADRVYPAGHAYLLQRIVETGAVISEVAPGAAPTKFRFLRRNRLIAALGAATVVVEAAQRSGSLSTAGAAAELGRPLGAVPGSVLSTTSAGCHRLLREYDAVCVTCGDDARELMALGGEHPGGAGDRPLAAPVDPVTLRVRDALGTRAWRSVDDIARSSGVAPTEVTAALGLLGLEGAAEQDGGRWRLGRGS
ncbi:DNA-processing protein DprA [Microbacterium sp. JB110]|uniref:DNA-processing protein DprA n=1 Tax=Microbacterium sp. JB110 TaxID=2024477 RepID=UPI00097E8DDD|nr:DNA-processing protein DprA [Microbacterium sp. JB110]RCS62766.1 DNA-protecting protein DprA [Microbacterium sp. JB110]SJM62894.1 Rossmann fold nucleotide-binding protein Smf possibly involved in DNA uptake [Frigoribacterium sp. JB110]